MKCIVFSSLLIAQNNAPFVSFTNLKTEQGLANNHISAITQDSFGFIWVGTTSGLCRYDSKEEFTTFTKANSGLKSNNIRALLTDSKNQLWIGTRLGGLSCFNQSTGVWKTYMHNSDDPNSLSDNEVLTIIEDKKGRIWVGTENGINLYLKETDNFVSWSEVKGDPNALPGTAILDIHEDNRGFIWVGLWDGGLNLILNSDHDDYSNYSFRNFRLNGNISADNVWKITNDNKGHLWIGTHGGGLFSVKIPDAASNSSDVQEWNLKEYTFNVINSNLGSQTIDEILIDQLGDFWFGTTAGIFHISKKSVDLIHTDEFEASNVNFICYKHELENQESLGNNVINCLLQSNEGLIWVGTISGLSHFKNGEKRVEFYNLPLLNKHHNLNSNIIIKEGSIWMTAGPEGLIQFSIPDLEEKKIKIPGLEKGTSFYSMCSPEKEIFLIATNKGIVEFNYVTGTSIVYPASNKILKETNNLFSRNVFQDSKGLIYLSTEYKLVTFDKNTKKYQIHNSDRDDEESISDLSLNQIIEDSKGTIWLSTYRGLNKITGKKGDKIIFKRYLNTISGDKINFKSNQIISLAEVNKILYIGTTNGFTCINLETEEQVLNEISKFEGFVVSIEKDENNNLWFSTMNGVNFYNTTTNTLTKLGKGDGFYDRAFRLMTSNTGDDGYLYFASHLGIYRINPNFSNSIAAPPPVYITEAKTINNKSQKIINLSNVQEITLDPNNYYLELKFVGLNYDRIEETKYSYKLEGLDDDWFYTDKLTSAVYTNLEPGDYIFKAKAANHQGVWNEDGNEIKISKKAFISETIWFKTLLALAMITLVWFLIYLYVKNIKKNNQALQDFNNNLNKEIEERMKVEKDLLQSNQDLKQFAYSASHDLQEPLRNIGNAVGLLKRKNEFDEKSNEYVEIAVGGVKRMSSLIQNLLDYAKTGAHDQYLESTNLNTVVKDKLKGLKTLIEEKNATIRIKELPTINCESNQIGVVFFNLINNAIKFNDKANPEIEIGSSINSPSGKWQFYVKDNGKGIPPEYQNRIFEMFTRLENKREYKGTGIGLTLCQKIITRHGGTIWVSSTPKEGSTFFFTINKELA